MAISCLICEWNLLHAYSIQSLNSTCHKELTLIKNVFAGITFIDSSALEHPRAQNPSMPIPSWRDLTGGCKAQERDPSGPCKKRVRFEIPYYDPYDRVSSSSIINLTINITIGIPGISCILKL